MLVQAHASTATGTIDGTYHYARVCHDSSCATYGTLNFLPTVTGTSTPVTITDSLITGYVWGDEVGWVNLQPTGNGVVVNPSTGALSGNAFSQNSGFINFSPTNGGVSINSNGEFTGYAWSGGMYGGWVKFDCSSASTCVKTDWRPIAYRNVTPPATSTPSGGGGGAVSYFINDPISPYRNVVLPNASSSFSNQTTDPVSEQLQPLGQVTDQPLGAIYKKEFTSLGCSIPPVAEVAGDKSSSVTYKKLTRPLYRGVKSSEVRVLQAFLSTRESFYPTSSVTGYFGSLTERGVKCFQLKYGIASSKDKVVFGYVGPATRAKIHTLIK